MAAEIWRPIRGFSGKYEVSSRGRVKKIIELKNGKKEISELPQYPNNRGGYMVVHLYKDGKHKCCQVHRLVAHAFIPNRTRHFRQVNHIDGNKTNNKVSNLRWATHKQNIQYAKKKRNYV